MNDPEMLQTDWQQFAVLSTAIRTFALCILVGCALIFVAHVVALVLHWRDVTRRDAAARREAEREDAEDPEGMTRFAPHAARRFVTAVRHDPRSPL